MVKKVELHAHLEGTAPPSLIKKIADRNNLPLSDKIVSKEHNHFIWHDFLNFLDVYEQASMTIRQPIDYYDITYQYLKQCAQEGCIYTEMMYSPEHAERATGLPSKELLAATCQAILDAENDLGIIGRLHYAAVRHYGVEACEAVAQQAYDDPNPYVVGLNLAGDEAGFPPAQFKRAFEIAKDAGLGLTAHAGEMVGPSSMIEALDNLPITRIGHGVRVIEDKELMARVKDLNIHLEVCPTSNLALGVFPDYQSHPLRQLFDSGIQLSINSDDPPYFHCTIGGEYQIAKQEMNFTDEELKKVSLMAIDAAFIDDALKEKLRQRVIYPE